MCPCAVGAVAKVDEAERENEGHEQNGCEDDLRDVSLEIHYVRMPGTDFCEKCLLVFTSR